MRTHVALALGVALVLFAHAGGERSMSLDAGWLSDSPASRPATPPSPLQLTDVVDQYCVSCHNDRRLTGNLSLERFEVPRAPELAETAERMILKVRAGMMPPPGRPRPSADTLLTLVHTLEDLIDEAAAKSPAPGRRSFQRLNRAEYEASIRELLGLEIRAADYLPLDPKSANFDNIADAQILSPTLLDAYLRAAAEISRLAVGDRDVAPSESTYNKSGYHSQWERAEGAPFGTRGGIVAEHNFPADGGYVLKMAFDNTTTGGFYGDIARDQQIEIAVDGVRVMLLDVDQFMHVQDPNGTNMETEPFHVPAGAHTVSATFLSTHEGPIVDLMSPHDWSLVDRRIGSGGYGVTALPHMKDLIISGPSHVTGVSETPTRRRIFTCRPSASGQARFCAESIVRRLGRLAYRRSLTDVETEELLWFYNEGAAEAGFEEGVRLALQAILASPPFVFRFEPLASSVGEGEVGRISGPALASRLSFFLWGAPPDSELIGLGESGTLHRPDVLEAQVSRMLTDARSSALGTRFAAQWLRLDDLDKIHPDRLLYPDFHQQLADAMRAESEALFNHLVDEDRSLLELYTARYTYLNERLARHYGVPGVVGESLRRVELPDDRRAGILGHGSVLTLTSVANRTSPVLRGKWVLEVLLGTPPPAPPPNVPDFEETAGAEAGRPLTTRERMELHRANPTCNACHRFIDPVGLAMDNFDVTGRWRIRENGVPLDTQGEFYDGTPLSNTEDLRTVLLDRRELLVRTFTANLMAYALGRRVEYFDMPAVRSIVREAEANGYRMSSFIRGVVRSDAFQLVASPETDEAAMRGGAR